MLPMWSRARWCWLYLLLAFLGPHFGPQVRVPTLWLSRILLVLGLGYLAIRVFGAHTHWLWSLRNQLIAVYFFVSILPILLQVVMTALALYLLYWHFGAYLVYADLERRIEQVASTADTLTTAYALEIASTGAKAPIGPISEPPPRTAIFLAAAQENLPGLKIEVGAGQELLARATDRRHLRFVGLVTDHEAVELRAVVGRRVNGQQLIVSAEVPVTPELLATLEPEFGPIEIITARPTERARQPGVAFPSRGRVLAPVREVQSAGQSARSASALVRLQRDRLLQAGCGESGGRIQLWRRCAGDPALHGARIGTERTAARAGGRMGRHRGDGVVGGRRDVCAHRGRRTDAAAFPSRARSRVP